MLWFTTHCIGLFAKINPRWFGSGSCTFRFVKLKICFSRECFTDLICNSFKHVLIVKCLMTLNLIQITSNLVICFILLLCISVLWILNNYFHLWFFSVDLLLHFFGLFRGKINNEIITLLKFVFPLLLWSFTLWLICNLLRILSALSSSFRFLDIIVLSFLLVLLFLLLLFLLSVAVTICVLSLRLLLLLDIFLLLFLLLFLFVLLLVSCRLLCLFLLLCRRLVPVFLLLVLFLLFVLFDVVGLIHVGFCSVFFGWHFFAKD